MYADQLWLHATSISSTECDPPNTNPPPIYTNTKPLHCQQLGTLLLSLSAALEFDMREPLHPWHHCSATSYKQCMTSTSVQCTTQPDGWVTLQLAHITESGHRQGREEELFQLQPHVCTGTDMLTHMYLHEGTHRMPTIVHNVSSMLEYSNDSNDKDEWQGGSHTTLISGDATPQIRSTKWCDTRKKHTFWYSTFDQMCIRKHMIRRRICTEEKIAAKYGSHAKHNNPNLSTQHYHSIPTWEVAVWPLTPQCQAAAV